MLTLCGESPIIVLAQGPKEIPTQAQCPRVPDLRPYRGDVVVPDPSVSRQGVKRHRLAIENNNSRRVVLFELDDLVVRQDAVTWANAQRRSSDSVHVRVSERPGPTVQRQAHHDLLRRHPGLDPRPESEARADVAAAVVERRLGAGEVFPLPVVVEAHRADPVHVLPDRTCRVRPRLAEPEHEPRREVHRRRQKQARPSTGFGVFDYGLPPLPVQQGKVRHVLVVGRELPVEVDAVEPVPPGHFNGGVDEDCAGGSGAGHLGEHDRVVPASSNG